MAYQLDMSMMFAMHDALRRELAQVGRVAGRRDDNPATLLRAAAAGHPDQVAVLDALEAEHAVIEPLLAAIDAAAADPHYGHQRFGDIIDELSAQLTAHLYHE